MRAHVLDILFPSDVPQKPYFLKMILRFGDSDSQLVVVIYPDKEKYWVRRCEIISYSLAGMEKGQLYDLITRMVSDNPGVKEQEIAAKVKVEVRRFSVAPETVNRALNELKAIRISPVLADRDAMDGYVARYEFWYDNWKEAVHYAIDGPFRGTSQDQLVQWMIKFKSHLGEILKSSSGPSGPPAE